MKKNGNFIIFYSLLIITLFFLGWTFYENVYLNKDNKVNYYPLMTYEIEVPGFNLINYTTNNESIYFLYKKNNYYVIKMINTLNNKETAYSYTINATCHLQNENNYPYISCLDEKNIYVYNIDFTNILKTQVDTIPSFAINKDGQFSIYEDTENLKYATCNTNCYLLKDNEVDDITTLYKDSELLETKITAYGYYDNGIFTYKSNKIKIYNTLNNEYKEFSSPINNLNENKIALGANNYYLYILSNQEVKIYNLYNKENFDNIDISKVKGTILNINIQNGKMYLYTSNLLYVYDISEIEKSNLDSSIEYEDNLINNKVQYFQENYLVNINVFTNPNYLNNNYNITPVNNYNDIIDSIDVLEDYFILYNKEFFKRFYEFGMNGLEIYFAEDIVGITDGYDKTDVVGLYFKSNNKYIMIFKLNSNEKIRNIVSHELMHAIEDYLKSNGETFANWNNYNPKDFSYSHTYYVNTIYNDTLNNNKDSNNIYFVDNYARSSASEDRARLFEYICIGEDFDNYPHLNAKTNYLKSIILKNFPELYYVKYFNN